MIPLPTLLQRFAARYRAALITKAAVFTGLGMGCCALLAWRLQGVAPDARWRFGLPLALAAGLLAAQAVWLRRRWMDRRKAAAFLDRALNLQQRLVTAEEFSRQPGASPLYPVLLEEISGRFSTNQVRYPRPLDHRSSVLAIALLLLLLWPRLNRVLPPALRQPEPPPQSQEQRQEPPPSPQQPPQDQPQAGGGGQQPQGDQGQQQQQDQQQAGQGGQQPQSQTGEQRPPSEGAGQPEQSQGQRQDQQRQPSGQPQGQQSQEQGQPQADSGQPQAQQQSSASSAQQQSVQRQQQAARDAQQGQERQEQQQGRQAGQQGQKPQQAKGQQGQQQQAQGQQQGAQQRQQSPDAREGAGEQGSGQTFGEGEALKADIQQLLKEMSGELESLQAQLAAANEQPQPPPGTGTDPNLYGGESPEALAEKRANPIQLKTDNAATRGGRPDRGVGKPSGEVSEAAPKTEAQDAQLTDQPLEESSASRQPVPAEYRTIFDHLQQRDTTKGE